MSAVQDTADIKERKRNTGDWRGLPYLLGCLSGLSLLGAVIGLWAAFADSTKFRGGAVANDWLIVVAFIGSAIGIYCLAAIIAALRGFLRDR